MLLLVTTSTNETKFKSPELLLKNNKIHGTKKTIITP